MNAAGSCALGFETERLRVRPLNADDEALYRELYTDPETMRYIAPPLSLESASSSFQTVLALQGALTLKSRFLVIEERDTSQSVGICGTSDYDAAALRLEVGIVLKPAATSRGIATEALEGLVKRIFEASPVDEIWSECSRLHLAAARLVSTIGFKRLAGGEKNTELLKKGIWALSRSMWHKSQGGYAGGNLQARPITGRGAVGR